MGCDSQFDDPRPDGEEDRRKELWKRKQRLLPKVLAVEVSKLTLGELIEVIDQIRMGGTISDYQISALEKIAAKK